MATERNRGYHRMSIDILPENFDVLRDVAHRRHASIRKVVLDALRVFQILERRKRDGYRLYMEKPDGSKVELEIL